MEIGPQNVIVCAVLSLASAKKDRAEGNFNLMLFATVHDWNQDDECHACRALLLFVDRAPLGLRKRGLSDAHRAIQLGHAHGILTLQSFSTSPQGIAFTGDTLLIRGCGRTDFQEGDSRMLYKNVYEHIFSLPDNFRLFPAHDYKWVTIWAFDIPRVNQSPGACTVSGL